MKKLTATFLAVLIASASGYLIKVPGIQQPVRTVPLGWLHVQKLLLPLFENVCEASTNPAIVHISQEFTLDTILPCYTNPESINNLKNMYLSNNQLPKGEIFSELNQDHMLELKILFDVLYNAQNFDTFYKVAAWARQNVNCGVFVNAIYWAILERHDTKKITVPGPYELLPNYFIDRDVIIKASSLLAGEDITLSENVLNEGNSYTLNANYTGNADASDESKLAYFQEDIGLNSYYFLKRLKFMTWSLDEDVDNDHGLWMYHFMKNLVARYNLERYSNGLMFLEEIDWKTDSLCYYDPMLVFSNGEAFSQQLGASDLSDPAYRALQSIEENVMSMVYPLVQKGYSKSQIINNIMPLLMSGLNSYEAEACRYFGRGESVENRWRSVLVHRMTSLRDPIFWKINKKIVDIVDTVLKVLPGYTRTELYLPGVQIHNVEVKKINTMFEPFNFDVTNALKTSTENPLFQVNILQSRLNNKPFTVKLNISSLVTQKGLVKLYLGPKILPGEFNMKKNLFMLLDSFEVNLKVGSNVISKTSNSIESLSTDFTSLNDLRNLVGDAEYGFDVQPPKTVETLTGFPSRLILPKGTPEGLPMQLLAFVAPFTKVTAAGLNLVPRTEFNPAVLSPGYPFDLNFDDETFFALPNVLVKDILVTHKGGNGANKGANGATGGKKWDDENTSYSYGPNREPFNYNLKKSQYGEQTDYTNNKNQYYKGKTEETTVTNPVITENGKLANKEYLNMDADQNEHGISDSDNFRANDEALGYILSNEPVYDDLRLKPLTEKRYADYIYE